ncbi:diguanylate cyclase (GGDEF)-like protein [Rhizobium pisi]|uniref:diguanylate cyclase n=1 Tax=Rhizobium pisi TaxID=574561 RepID=A0A427N2M5_9HYPH|nr:GGDEF domain-containing protein [Rhizobium pisi]MBB3134176.1 diguanylate cyclase (GGDEF)-like protein [Rhizobium pisi]RSB81101.1 GGDEF domain-containing protein [Rhizobium pisi]TCA60169.1 GGDEF domain-containing protein [Rhizobium pisi]
MEALNLALFVVEAVAYFTLMVMLLHFRHRLGLGVFLTALGVMHFMETYLAAVFYVSLPFGDVSPGSSVFFSGKLMMILMLYLQEDAATVRQPIYGLFFGNLLTVGIAWVLQLHHPLEISPDHTPDVDFLKEMGWLMVWGTALLYVDSLGIILLYEKLGDFFRRRVVLRFMICGFALLTFDQIGFFAALHYFLDVPVAAFWGGWKAKMFAVCLYAVMFAIYEYRIRRVGSAAAARSISDVFGDLTFRERYNDLLERTGRDMLTGVYDRTRMELEAPLMLNEASRQGLFATVLIIDADHFKDVNDGYGHLQGDEVLKAIAARLGTTLRSSDRIFRFGGEEFVAVCPGTNHEEGLLLAERLRWTIATSVQTPDDKPVTVSIGIATADEDGTSFTTVLSVADGRLYEAKKSGRNCIVGRSGVVKLS